jgi:hypothetical protein
VPLRRRLGLPDVRPGPRKVGLRQARGCAGRQRAFKPAPVPRLLASAARVPVETLSVSPGDATWHSKAFSGIMCHIGWLLTPETPRTFIRSVAKQRMENNQHLRLWVSVGGCTGASAAIAIDQPVTGLCSV